MDAVPGLYSALLAKGSALYIFLPSLAVIRNLYSSPVATPGMKSPQMPTGPSFSIGCASSSQSLKLPITCTSLALGAQTPK